MQAHGVLMCLSWGVLIPLGAIIARNFKTLSATWFNLHRGIQVCPPFKITMAFLHVIPIREYARRAMPKMNVCL
jgi:hypothetical protein